MSAWTGMAEKTRPISPRVVCARVSTSAVIALRCWHDTAGFGNHCVEFKKIYITLVEATVRNFSSGTIDAFWVFPFVRELKTTTKNTPTSLISFENWYIHVFLTTSRLFQQVQICVMLPNYPTETELVQNATVAKNIKRQEWKIRHLPSSNFYLGKEMFQNLERTCCITIVFLVEVNLLFADVLVSWRQRLKVLANSSNRWLASYANTL